MAPSSTRRLQLQLDHLLSQDPAAGGIAERIDLMQMLRGTSPEHAREVDGVLLAKIFDLQAAARQAGEIQAELRAVVDKLTAPPWHPGRLLQSIEIEGQARALVHCGSSIRLVEFGDGLSADSLDRGAPIFLNQDLNVLMCGAPGDPMRCGETASFDRRTADGRLVLRWRDEEMIVDAGSALDPDSLSVGDEVRWDRGALMAVERIESGGGQQYLHDEVLDVGPESVGGQDRCLDELLRELTTTLVAPELADDYDVNGRRSILLYGPPGCGKTLMARVAAAQISRISGRRCGFFVVKPGEWESPWVGESQANIRKCFQALHKAAEGGNAVLFMDEVESVGRHRGGAASHHADKFTAAWLAELDGFVNRGDVAVVSATNRRDLIDQALLERLSDVAIRVPRPDSRGAARIFEIHLGEKVPVYPNGHAAAATRCEIVETAVSRLYAPNGDNALCTLHFRDGKTQPVAAKSLISGRLIEQICRSARERAFARHLAGGTPGVQVADMEMAVAGAIERLATTLSVRNVHQYLDELPDDVDVVRVEMPRKNVKRPLRYVNEA
jgi:ATP-dependent 26S proteasome regulatory subunit